MAYSKNAQIELRGDSAHLEWNLLPITKELNDKALRVNKETWLLNLAAMEREALDLTELCRREARDDDFRPNSPADCARVFFTERGYKTWQSKVSKSTGRQSVNQDVLAEFANEGDKLAELVLAARGAISRWSQLKAWKVYAEAGQVQSTWDSLGQPHGRYTSDNPCLNNRIVPVRETIEPDPGYSFLSVDLGQAEYLTWASLSGDPVLGQAFKEGKDFHTEMAQLIHNLVPEWNLRGQEMRAAGKTINFAILYQMQPGTLAKKLGCSGEVAQKIIAAYYQRAAKAAGYIQEVLAKAKQDGFVETKYGRRRYCKEYQVVEDGYEKHELEKTIWHHHNAGTAAEILKFKQVEIWMRLRELDCAENLVRLSLNMYDELIWMVRDDVLSLAIPVVEGIMKKEVEGFLPIPVTVKVGKNWKEISK